LLIGQKSKNKKNIRITLKIKQKFFVAIYTKKNLNWKDMNNYLKKWKKNLKKILGKVC
jgi:hypothetical protein